MHLLDVPFIIITWTRTVGTGSTGSMTTVRSSSSTRTGVWMAFASMCLVQVGVAASVWQFDQLGVAGTSWLRLTWAAVILLAVGRPWRLRLTRSTVALCTALGVATAGSTVLFLAAVDRLPLGTACALEFLGPLTVAVVHGRGRARLWVLPAAAGVALLTEPWQGGIDGLGVTAALGAAVCWGAYIVLTQRAADAVAGV
jgi:inner membrane transporter RhtA